jgi:hypothetical protein
MVAQLRNTSSRHVFGLRFEICITAVLDNEKCKIVQIVVCCGVLMNNMKWTSTEVRDCHFRGQNKSYGD